MPSPCISDQGDLPLGFGAYLLCHFFPEALSDAGRLSWDARDPRYPLLRLVYPALMPEFSSRSWDWLCYFPLPQLSERGTHVE